MKNVMRIVACLMLLVGVGAAQNQTSTGIVGPRGYTGARGPSGTFAVGNIYTGDPGTNASFVNVGTSSAGVFNITIPRGSVIYSGSGSPANATGGNSDYYIDSVAHCLYGPKTTGTGAWPGSCTDFVGAAGPTGPAGPQGPVGPGGTPTGTPLHLAGFLPGSGSTNLTQYGFETDSTLSDISNIRYLGVNKAINNRLNYDGYGSYANIASSGDCDEGCTIDVAPDSPTTESPYASSSFLPTATHVKYTAGGQQNDVYNDPNYGNNSIRIGEQKQCYFSTTLAPAQVTGCFGIVDTSVASGTYQGSPWQVHATIPISSWVNGRAIHQVLSMQSFINTGGDSGNFYSYMKARCALIATSDEGCLHASFQLFENAPPFGTILVGGQSATVVKSDFNLNGNNAGDYFDLVSLDPTDVAASGLILTNGLDSVTQTTHVTTSDTHAVSTAIGNLVEDCGVAGLARNAGQQVSCLVTQKGSDPFAFTAGNQPICIADYRYVEQVFASAVGTGTAWQANHGYTIGDIFYDGANYEQVQNVGGSATSGSTPPTWPTTVGAEVLDVATTVNYQLIALGSNSTVITATLAYAHPAIPDGGTNTVLAQGGLCGHGMVLGNGNSNPLFVGSWVSLPIQYSEDATSFNYVAPYVGGQEGPSPYPIAGNPGRSWDNFSRVGNTVTAYEEGGDTFFNGYTAPDGATITVTTGNPNFDAATSFSNITEIMGVNPANGLNAIIMTYTDNLSATDSGNGGTFVISGMNNYSAPCRAETIQVLGTSPRGPNEDSGLAWGDGSLMLEPNGCKWTVGTADAQPNAFNAGYGGMRISSNVFTPAWVNSNQMLKLGLTGQGNSGAPFISFNEEGEDALSSMYGHGGTNVGHWLLQTDDWLQGGISLLSTPINGGVFVSFGNRAPGDGHTIFPFFDAVTDVGHVQMQIDQVAGNINLITAGSGLVTASGYSTPVSNISEFLKGANPTYDNGSAYMENEFGWVTLSSNSRANTNAWKSDQVMSLGGLYGAKLYAGSVGTPVSRGIFPNGSAGTGSSNWCYAAVGQTSVGHGTSSGNVCFTGAATLDADNSLFVKFFQTPGTQTFRIFRTDSPDHTAFPLGTLCASALVALQGCNDTGQAVVDSDDPSLYLDTSGSSYLGGLVQVPSSTTPGTVLSGATAAGSACSVTGITNGIITAATCTP